AHDANRIERGREMQCNVGADETAAAGDQYVSHTEASRRSQCPKGIRRSRPPSPRRCIADDATKLVTITGAATTAIQARRHRPRTTALPYRHASIESPRKCKLIMSTKPSTD